MAELIREYIERFRNRIEELDREIAPLVEERDEIETALAALRASSAREKPRRLPARVRKEQIVRVVSEIPGVRVGEVAEQLGLSVPRVVQLVNELEQDRAVARRDGGGLERAK